AALSAEIQDALAAVERRHGAGPALGRPGVRAPLRPKHAPLRRRRLRSKRAAGHEDGLASARPEAVRPAPAGVSILRQRVRALLAFLPGVRPDRLQPGHAAGSLAARVRATLRERGRAVLGTRLTSR